MCQRTALKAAFTSLPVVCLPQLFAEMENEVSSAKDRSFVCAQRSWTGALAGKVVIVLIFTEA